MFVAGEDASWFRNLPYPAAALTLIVYRRQVVSLFLSKYRPQPSSGKVLPFFNLRAVSVFLISANGRLI